MFAVADSTAGKARYLQVTWTDSTDPNAATVNVYRSTVSGGPYALLTTGIPMGTQLYNDFGVTGGVTYFYVTTEVNTSGSESGFSVEQSATALP